MRRSSVATATGRSDSSWCVCAIPVIRTGSDANGERPPPRLVVWRRWAPLVAIVGLMVLVFAMAFVVINLVVDLSYGALDPRVSRQG